MNLLLQKYRILGKKGEGTFSEVLKCQVIKDGSYRACKKMKQTYDSIEQVNNLREIQAMRRLAPHPNVLELEEVIFDKKSGTLILVCELMDMNIYEMIRGKRHYLPERKIKNFMFQLLKSIDHMHRNGIFHRDVKPENILIKEDVLKLADFGSCRSVYSKQPYTEYISTRWYRAPECLLTDGYYNYKMDMWSVGCVFFEILSLHPLFPGSNEVDQIAKIHDVMGTPDSSVLNKLKRSRGMNFNFPPKKGSGIERLLTHVSPEAIELIYLMCCYDPDERITARQALKHTYFRELREVDKRAALAAKQRKSQANHPQQQQQSQKADSKGPPSVKEDNEISEKIIQLDEDPSSPLKTRMTEITMYPTLPKAQSHPTHPFKERRRSKNKALPKVDFYASETDDGSTKTGPGGGVGGGGGGGGGGGAEGKKKKKKHKHKRIVESHQYPHHTGLLPRVPMHPATFNPTFHTTSFPTSFNKLPAAAATHSLLPTINNAYKPHKSPTKTTKALYNQYTLPSLDQRRF